MQIIGIRYIKTTYNGNIYGRLNEVKYVYLSCNKTQLKWYNATISENEWNNLTVTSIPVEDLQDI